MCRRSTTRLPATPGAARVVGGCHFVVSDKGDEREGSYRSRQSQTEQWSPRVRFALSPLCARPYRQGRGGGVRRGAWRADDPQ